jgi:hypothetical protein
MTTTTLALSAAGSLVSALLYLYIGSVLRQRAVSPAARLANNMFVLWWVGLGGIGVLGVVVQGAYLVDRLPLWVYEAYTILVLLVIFAALWGLQYYLVYLYTGSTRSFVPLGVFYALFFTATIGLLEYLGDPAALTDNGWQLRTEPRVELPLAAGLVFVLLLVGPQVVAAVAYARLFTKTSDRTQRYRIAMVTGSILVWFGSSIVAAALQFSDSLAWQFTSRAIGIVGALVILAAYRPPRWVRDRYGIRSVRDDGPQAAA